GAKGGLAWGATRAGTAANTGGGPFLPAERTEAGKLIFQLNRAGWMREAKILSRADAVEIALGHGALGPAPSIIAEEELEIDPEFRAALAGTRPAIEAVLPEGHGAEALHVLVRRLRALTGGVPVGIKIGATDRIEEELEAILSAEPDFIALDGGEGGTHGLATAIHDAVCLPTLQALCRTERFLQMKGVRDRLSLLVGGGLAQPADLLKAMALGADAVYIGTAALLAIAHGQVEKATPFEPPTELVFHRGARAAAFDPEKGALHLMRYLRSCVAEMELVAKTLGRRSLAEVGRDDLCCLDRGLAELAGVRWAGLPPAPEDARFL
ncbi:MAG: FMN-binding glutamate synthase family protein, partial [Firmicutes bacterium]|nr:FMN-binding glutamate synthase family protein [Bacillota bacterium]